MTNPMNEQTEMQNGTAPPPQIPPIIGVSLPDTGRADEHIQAAFESAEFRQWFDTLFDEVFEIHSDVVDQPDIPIDFTNVTSGRFNMILGVYGSIGEAFREYMFRAVKLDIIQDTQSQIDYIEEDGQYNVFTIPLTSLCNPFGNLHWNVTNGRVRHEYQCSRAVK